MFELVIGFVLVGLALAGVVVARRANADEVFAGLTPGLAPAPGQPVTRRVLGAGEKPVVAVRFEPPAGLRPGLSGVVIDSRIDPVELSATLINLAIRGWLVLKPILPQDSGEGPTRPAGWELHQVPQPPSEPLSPSEQAVLAAAFAAGPTATVAELRVGHRLQYPAQVLAQEAAAQGWFRATALSWLRPLGVVALVAGVLSWILGLQGLGAGIAAAALVLLVGTAGLGQPLSAEGFAARYQALGFKQYLATAEAEQLRFEVGVDVFGRYLPYAMVFGVVDHWRTVFADALRAEVDAGSELVGFGWLALDNALTSLVLIDLLTGDAGLFDNLGDGFGGELGAEATGLDAGDGDAGDFGDTDTDTDTDAGADGSGGDSGWGDSGWGDSGGFDGGGFDGGGFE